MTDKMVDFYRSVDNAPEDWDEHRLAQVSADVDAEHGLSVNDEPAVPARDWTADDASEVAVPAADLSAVTSIAILGDLIEMIGPHTEADPWGLIADLLTSFGSAVGPGPHFVADGARHTARLFVVLVGRSSRARKGTTRHQIANLMEPVDEGWAASRVMGGLGSGEGLIRALVDEDDDEPADRRLMLFEPEFSRVLRVASRDGSVVSEIIRQAWDGGRLSILRSQDPLRVDDSHVSLIGHITADELRARASRIDLANGLANRVLWIGVERSKLLPDGGALDERDLRTLATDLRARLDLARSRERVDRTPEGRDLWHDTYRRLADQEQPGVVGAVCARAEAQVLRLSLCCALLDGKPGIDARHVEAALAIWGHAERTAISVWGDRTGNGLADRLLKAIRNAGPGGLDGTAQRRAVGGHASRDELDDARALLERRGLVRSEKVRTAGRSRLLSYAR